MKAKRRHRKQRQSEVQLEKTPFFGAGREAKSSLFFQSPNVQAKLTVGSPGDKYEQQADHVASKVVRAEGLQRQEDKKVRRQEEEEMQTKLQRQEEEEVQARLQRQSEAEEEEMQTKLQKQEEEETQTKLQRQEEEEEPVQAKEIQRKEAKASAALEARIDSQKGGGFPLPDEVREDMEHKMNASFRHVRIHNDNVADQLCQDLNALAFTIGNDVFFRSGQYQPNSASGIELLAHELTHVMQQRKGI
jgi:hypothetical protein